MGNVMAIGAKDLASSVHRVCGLNVKVIDCPSIVALWV
jgi:hypothetical protein